MKSTGVIESFNGLIVNVTTNIADQPSPQTIAYLKDNPEILLLIISYEDKNLARCINITGSSLVSLGAEVVLTNEEPMIPVGKEIIGHVFDALGRPIDTDQSFSTSDKVSIYAKPATKKYRAPNNEIIETGIKVIDFFTPFVKGNKIGIVGGAGVGKTVLTTELMHNVSNAKNKLTIFVGIGERIREGHELYNTLKDKDLLKSSIMYLGQMNENASLRSLIGQTASQAARYFRNQYGDDILFFVDNIYRHIQANNELSTMIGDLPAEGGYQPSMYSDIKRLLDKLDSAEKGSTTSVHSIFIPADDLTDPAVVEITQQLDSIIVLSREVFENGIFPAVDLLNTSSAQLNKETIGEEHYALVTRVKEILQTYESLKNIIAVIGESELSPADRKDYQTALKLIDFFTQAMSVTEDLSGIPGQYVPRDKTLKGIKAILEA